MTRENVFSPDSLSCYAGVYIAISETQLSGFVDSQDAVYKAVQTTRGVGRAMSVKNSLFIKNRRLLIFVSKEVAAAARKTNEEVTAA